MEHARTDLKMMSRYLQSISPERIDATNINQYLRNQKIIALTGADYPTFVEELKTSLLAFASDPVQQENGVSSTSRSSIRSPFSASLSAAGCASSTRHTAAIMKTRTPAAAC